MDNPAEYLQSFHMFDYIGGRFSATSMVSAPPPLPPVQSGHVSSIPPY